jgi:branched-subunit amino acid permease
MKTSLQISKVLNSPALFCLLGGIYGLPFTGVLQILAALFFLYAFPKSKSIYTYFVLVIVVFIVLKTGYVDPLTGLIFAPLLLITYLSYLIYSKKINNEILSK